MLKELEAPLVLERLDVLIKERIFDRTIASFYDEFKKRGLLQQEIDLLSKMPPELLPPIQDTLITHVTKEKPIFVYALGSACQPDSEKTRMIASVIDLVWAASLMIDDIFDQDTHRADRKAGWVMYGSELVVKSCDALLKVIYRQLSQDYSFATACCLEECIKDGLTSLQAPEIGTFSTDIDKIKANIKQRARFHCEFPMFSVESCFPTKQNICQSGAQALFSVNFAGQILNDVKDLVTPTNKNSRVRFSDLRGGIVTLPLLLLAETIPSRADREFFRSKLGCKFLLEDEEIWVSKMVKDYLPTKRIYEIIVGDYTNFLQTMKTILKEPDYAFCCLWVDYKLKQAQTLLSL